MTTDEIIELARAAGMRLDKHNGGFVNKSELLRFAALVRAAALEEAIAVLEFHGFDDAVPYINWAKANPKEK